MDNRLSEIGRVYGAVNFDENRQIWVSIIYHELPDGELRQYSTNKIFLSEKDAKDFTSAAIEAALNEYVKRTAH